MKKVVWIISGLLILLAAGLLFFNFVPGFDTYVVRSESMKPAINMGDIIITCPVGGLFGHAIKPGEIVTYKTGQSLVSHRVFSFDGNTLTTKGDAVQKPDPQPVTISQVQGLYIFKIPKLGYISAFIHTKIGWFLLIILPASVFVGFIIKEIIKEALFVTPFERQGDEMFKQKSP
jgi:signal peptidase I